MMFRFVVLLILALVCSSGCQTKNDCGDVRMFDPENDLCVCRPEFTPVGDLCIPNDEVDGGTDAGIDATTDAPTSDVMAEMCASSEECPERDNATRTCEGMTCGFECDEDWGDCDGDPTNGCETDLTSDQAHCGMCTNACDPLLCVDGACVDGAVQVCTGQGHNCVRRASGRVSCWGDNSSGQLGDGSFVDSFAGAVDALVDDAVDIDCGGFDFNGPVDAASCAVRSDGTVWCWGYGGNGTLGNGSLVDSNVPVQVEGVSRAVSVFVGAGHACATSSVGQVWCWGVFVPDGEGSLETRATPLQFPGVTKTPRAVAGRCFHFRDGTVSCWSTESLVLVDMGLTEVEQLVGAWTHHCARLADQSVVCWGSNQWGTLGTDLPVGTTPRNEPLPVQGGLRASWIAGHGLGMVALDEDSNPFFWGLDVRQPLGGALFDVRTPTAIPGLPDIVDLDYGRSHTCFALRGGSVACLGTGPIGSDETTFSMTPFSVPEIP